MMFKKILSIFTENIYLAFQFWKPNNTIDPVIDYLYIDNDSVFENNLANNILSYLLIAISIAFCSSGLSAISQFPFAISFV